MRRRPAGRNQARQARMAGVLLRQVRMPVTALINTPRCGLVCGRYQDVLSRVTSVGALISDPPFSSKTHDGHNRGHEFQSREMSDGIERRRIEYASWSPEDVAEFVRSWSPRVDGWFVAMTDHVLWPVYEAALVAAGRYVFHPIPVVIKGMTVRRAGDGPASWAFYLVVARPRTRAFLGGWARPGAYVGGRGRDARHIGGKPLWVPSKLVRDYTRPGDVVVDPCAGYGSTGVAALGFNDHTTPRRFIGAEVDADTAAIAARELGTPAGHSMRVAGALEVGAEWDVDQLEEQRDEARANARVLAHSYTHDSRPPQSAVDAALAYPNIPPRLRAEIEAS